NSQAFPCSAGRSPQYAGNRRRQFFDSGKIDPHSPKLCLRIHPPQIIQLSVRSVSSPVTGTVSRLPIQRKEPCLLFLRSAPPQIAGSGLLSRNTDFPRTSGKHFPVPGI